MSSFENKVVIITAGGAGMGKAAALAFARQGAHVCITDISEAALREAAEEIRAAGGSVTTMQGDATESDSVRAVVAGVLEEYGRVDILFNYVGGSPTGTIHRFTDDTEEEWQKMVDLNLLSAARFSRAVLDGMIDRRYGKIISTSSIGGKVGLEYGVMYSATKGGVIAFTKALARELGEYGINVNCVCPNTTTTPTMSKIMKGKEAVIDQVIASTPLGRLGAPEDVANAVLFLASDEASYITGQALSIDGGYTMI